MDSGVGGLAVLKRLVQQMPGSPYIFIGDTAWMPYGEKSLDVVCERVLQVYGWLNRFYDPAVFVLACNTATVAAYDELQATNPGYPILEPVKTTAEWVNAHFKAPLKIGILATPGTVTGGRYLQFLDPGFEVMQMPCKGLASVIEAGICSGPELDEVLFPYLMPLLACEADVIILGCTHYSFIRDYIQNISGPNVQLVDSAEVLATVAAPIIQNMNLLEGQQTLCITGDPTQFGKAIGQLPLSEFTRGQIQTFSVEEDTLLPVD